MLDLDDTLNAWSTASNGQKNVSRYISLRGGQLQQLIALNRLVDRGWAVSEAKEAFFQGFGVYDLLACVTGKTGPMLRRQNSSEVTRKRKLHVGGRRMAYDATADCSNFVVLPGEDSPEDANGFDGDLYAVFDLFTLDDRMPLSIKRPVGQRMMTLDSHGSGGQKKSPPNWKEKLPMTFAEELMATVPSVRDILKQTKSFWIPYSQSTHDILPRTLIFFTTDLERSWQIFDVSTDDETQNIIDIRSKQEAFDFVSGQILFRFFSSDLASKWSEVIAACSKHVTSLVSPYIAIARPIVAVSTIANKDRLGRKGISWQRHQRNLLKKYGKGRFSGNTWTKQSTSRLRFYKCSAAS